MPHKVPPFPKNQHSLIHHTLALPRPVTLRRNGLGRCSSHSSDAPPVGFAHSCVLKRRLPGIRHCQLLEYHDGTEKTHRILSRRRRGRSLRRRGGSSYEEAQERWPLFSFSYLNPCTYELCSANSHIVYVLVSLSAGPNFEALHWLSVMPFRTHCCRKPTRAMLSYACQQLFVKNEKRMSFI